MIELFDTHSHIIPNLDDGPDSESETLAMLELYKINRVTKIICTPHIFPGLYNNDRSSILEGVNRLKELISEHKLNIEVFPGSEVMAYFNLEKDVNTDKILTINDQNRFLFIEFPLAGVMPNFFEDLLFKIQIGGLTPVLSHPERYSFIIKTPSKIYSMVNRDICIQINSGSILGRFGKEVQKTADFLIRHRLFHLIGTDAHSVNSRPPDLMEAYKKISEYLTKEETEIIFKKNPEALVSNQGLFMLEPVPIDKSRKRFFGFLKKIFKPE